MELTRKDTKMLQGLSVLAMVWLHLFNKDYKGLFQPNIELFGVPFSYYLAQLSDFCVFGFAFCSGYAHMVLYDAPNFYINRIRSLVSLLLNYWTIMVLFSLVSITVGQSRFMPGTLIDFVLNCLLLSNSYNGAWWYMFAYVVLVLISPLLLHKVKSWHPIFILGAGFILYCYAYYVRFKIPTDNLLLLKFGPVGMIFFEYLIGALFYKEKIFTSIFNKINKINVSYRIVISVILFLGMLIGHTIFIPSFFIAPITGSVILCLFHFWRKPILAEKFFSLVGEHSTNIWLTHMFFYSTLFKNFVYIVRFPIFIFALMLLITLMISFVLHKIEKPLLQRFALKSHPEGFLQ